MLSTQAPMVATQASRCVAPAACERGGHPPGASPGEVHSGATACPPGRTRCPRCAWGAALPSPASSAPRRPHAHHSPPPPPPPPPPSSPPPQPPHEPRGAALTRPLLPPTLAPPVGEAASAPEPVVPTSAGSPPERPRCPVAEAGAEAAPLASLARSAEPGPEAGLPPPLKRSRVAGGRLGGGGGDEARGVCS